MGENIFSLFLFFFSAASYSGISVTSCRKVSSSKESQRHWLTLGGRNQLILPRYKNNSFFATKKKISFLRDIFHSNAATSPVGWSHFPFHTSLRLLHCFIPFFSSVIKPTATYI